MIFSDQGAIHETAPAKVNLALHVTGRRDDGYHLLDSVVTFAEDGDELTFETSDTDRLHLTGRFGGLLPADGEDGNLVTKARDLLRKALEKSGQDYAPVAITLEKNLPIASGIGGGSADAAATLRGLMRLWKVQLADEIVTSIALRLGADVPMCLSSTPLRARGIGEQLEPLEMPSFPMVLLNPLKAVSTPDVFRRLERRDNSPINDLPEAHAPAEWLRSLSALRNDLETPAAELIAEIAEASDLLRQSCADCVRMSGSGATCFGLYSDDAAALKAALALSAFKPDWYVLLTRTTAGSKP